MLDKTIEKIEAKQYELEAQKNVFRSFYDVRETYIAERDQARERGDSGTANYWDFSIKVLEDMVNSYFEKAI